MKDEQYATKLWKFEDILLCMYHGKPKKNVLLSTLHTDAVIETTKRKYPKLSRVTTKQSMVWMG